MFGAEFAHASALERKPHECVACKGRLQSSPIFEHSSIRLFQCIGCGSLNALPRPRANEQIALHDNSEYFAHPYFELRRTNKAALDKRCRAAFERIGKAFELSSLRGGKHLDIGCDVGSFVLAAAQIYGTIPSGIDIAERSVKEAVRAGLDAHCCSLERAPGRLSSLSLITAIDLVEHLTDPSSFMHEIRRRLQPGGVAYVETPNANSRLYLFGRILSRVTLGHPSSVFKRLFPPEHIQYFSRAGFDAIAKDAGLEVVVLQSRTIPFDEIGTGVLLRFAAWFAQLFDRLSGEAVLLCLVARRPVEAATAGRVA
jgi:2-polyprenyl-3-methyl-5-hydroxy-6-metoxy-1,4-benzoquinol methylase